MPDNRLREALNGAIHARMYRGWKRMLSGRRLDDDTVSMSGAPPGKCWVRGADESREQTAVWGSISRVNAGVVVGPGFDGADEIKTIDWEQATATHGDAARFLLQPIGGDEVLARSILGLGFIPGRVEPSTLGFAFIHVRAFDFDGGHWDDGELSGVPTAYDFDMTAYFTAAVGFSQWAKVYYDPADDALHAVAGEEQFGERSFLSQAALDAIAIPAGTYPLGGVRMTNGQTAWAATDFVDARLHLSPIGDIDAEWIINRSVIIPAAANAVVLNGIRVTPNGSFSVNGSVYIV